jgi:AcrR family transcriptional regulator
LAYRATARTEARRVEARQRLLDAARSLLREGGFAAVQVAAVAERAGLATGSVYRHVDSKAALCVELFEQASGREVDRMAQALDAGGVSTIAGAIRDWCERAQAGRVQAWALLGEPVGPEVEGARLRFRARYAEALQRAIEGAVAAGELPPQDARVAAAGVVGALGETVLGPHGDPDPEAVVAFALRALGARPEFLPSSGASP